MTEIVQRPRPDAGVDTDSDAGVDARLDTSLDAGLAESLRYVPRRLWRRDLGGGRVLRHAAPSEHGEVGDVLEAAFTAGCQVTEAYRAGLHRIDERARSANVWVVADAEGILGAVLTPRPQFHAGERFTFSILGVDPRGRGLGLGRVLVDHAVELARALGYREIEIRSGHAMTAAHGVYHRRGFVRRIDWETVVVDGGQRLMTFTLRLRDPLPRPPDIPRLPPPPVFALLPESEEVPVDLDALRPDGRLDAAGQFVPAAPSRPGAVGLPPEATGLRLVVPQDSARGWPAAIALRLDGLTDRVSVEYRPGGGSPRLLAADGGLLSDDWRHLSRALHLLAEGAGSRELYPRERRSEIDETDRVLQADLVDGLERALFSEGQLARDAAQRLFYARLGVLEVHLATHRYLLGPALTDADLTLFGVLVGFDVGYRSQLGWAPAALADYPNLWAYARELYQIPGFITEHERVVLGHAPGPDGGFRQAWGAPKLIEAVDDIRHAWLEPHGRTGS